MRRQIKTLDKAIEDTFAKHPQHDIIRSLPGMGPLVGAEFATAVGDLSTFAGPDQLAAYAGLAPIAHDSGKRSGNQHRPRRYHRPLRRAFYMAALTTIRAAGASRDYYQRKRAQGRSHKQALISLARRRINVLWALLRDNRIFQLEPPPRNEDHPGYQAKTVKGGALPRTPARLRDPDLPSPTGHHKGRPRTPVTSSPGRYAVASGEA